MTSRPDPRGDALLRAFARDLAKMRRDLRNLEAANQISSASIEGGTLDVYDDDDVLRERIGKQANGSYGRLVLEGPVPPTPSEPDVQVIADGVVAITWDGRCEEKWPFVEFEAVRVHLVEDPVAEVCDRDNQVGLILSHRGETIVAVTESDDDNPVYVRLVAVSSAGHTSDPSPAVLVDELDEDDLEEPEEQLEFHQDRWTLAVAGEQSLGLSFEPEQDSEHLYINGIEYSEADGWSRSGQTITLPADLARADDLVEVEYATMLSADVLVPFGASGWSYKQIAASDSTDYSGTGYDDSGWSTASAPFGAAGPDAPPLAPEILPRSGPWALDTRLWLRRTFPAASGVVVGIRVEDNCRIYVNGNFVAASPVNVGDGSGMSPGHRYDVPAEYLIPGDNLIALRFDDEAAVSSLDRTYADVEITGRLL